MTEIIRIGGVKNAVVVQLPERQQPGVVIQYDSLQNLLNLVTDAKQKAICQDWDESRELLVEIEQLIAGYAKAFGYQK